MATALKQDVNSRELPGGAPETPEQKGGKRRIVLPIVVVLVALALLWAFKQWSYGRSHESTDDAAVDGHLVPVLAKVSGYVQAVRVSDNDHVRADSVLVTIDPSEYRMRLAQAQADLAGAQATAGGGGSGGEGQAQAAVTQASGQQASLSAQITAARANATKAHQDLVRMEDLAGKQVVSRMQLDAARAAAEAADANVIAMQRQQNAATGTVASAQAGVRLAGARLQSAQAARDNAALQLSYTQVAAPVSGIVSRKQVEPGQLVQVGQPLFTIVSDTGAFVSANFKETQLADLRVGQPVEIEVDAYKGTVLGCVESVSAATGSKFALLPPDNATGNFTKVVQRVPVRIKVTKDLGPQQPLRPGMSVNVHVDTKLPVGKC
ncbi:MAG TPA: HlyD family secretion protein [Gemmatimonadaceae bacterium]|jgi:membrane fusion protein (multidrug efflux system)|nr:HlyD family secretion protein [Gemmatimonadaceae bacterium]